MHDVVRRSAYGYSRFAKTKLHSLVRQEFAAGRKHPTDSALTQMVVDIKLEALYPIVQSRGKCDHEFVVLNNFATVKSMFL